MRRILLLLVPLLLWNCGRQLEPATLAECLAAAKAARDTAQTQRAAGAPEEAAAAAQQAQHCAELAGTLLAALPAATAQDTATYCEVNAAARAAVTAAELAAEDALLHERLTSLKARAYEPLRRSALTASFKALAVAARQMQSAGQHTAPAQVRKLARAAEAFSSDRRRLADGSADWSGIADDMEVFAQHPPLMAGPTLTLILLMGGQNELALVEAFSRDNERMRAEPDARLCYHLLRAVTLSCNGLPRLAVAEADACAGFSDTGTTGQELVGGVNLLVAGLYLHNKNPAEADLALGRALQACPDHPLAVFITGETLAAGGQYEQAAESLEAACRGTEDEWLARRLALRARATRDQRGEVKPLFTDATFLCEVVFHLLRRTARDPGHSLGTHATEAARNMGTTVLRYLDRQYPAAEDGLPPESVNTAATDC